jgi:hypothetical protein
MSEPKFTGVWIPAAVFNANQMTTSAKLLYGVVAGLDGDDGCYASNAYLQRLLGVSERGVQVLLMELEQFGLIVRAQENGRRVIRTVEAIALGSVKGQYPLNMGGEENCGGEVQKTAGAPRRKLHPYNKEDNKEDKDTKGRAPKTPDFMLTQQPAHMTVPEFSAAWHRWVQYAFPKRKVPYMTYVGQLEFLNAMSAADAIESIETSIRNGWKGLFPARKGKMPTKALTKKDHDEF